MKKEAYEEFMEIIDIEKHKPKTEGQRLCLEVALKTSRMLLSGVDEEILEKSPFYQRHRQQVNYLERVLGD